jgi:glycosyltransferase involved in cell wall biosynthesis
LTQKKLAIYLPSLRGGGAERAMLTLANGIAERGYTVDLVLAKAEGPYLQEVSELVHVVDLGAPRVAKSLMGLVRYLRREQPVAILSALNYANIIAILAHKISRVHTRLYVSERNHFSVSNANAKHMKSGFIGYLMRMFYPHADGVIAVSKGVAEDLAANIGMSRSSIDVVYNPVVTERLLRKAAESCDHPWLKPGEPPVVLAVGRLTPQKDFITLLNALAKLRQSHKSRLLILGEGALRSALEAEIKKLDLVDFVQMPGFVDNPYPIMRASSLFVLSSAWEGLPNVLVQAMACGTPVVSTDCPSGPAEILENGKWGKLVPVGDEVAMAEAMAATLDVNEHPDVVRRAAEFSVDRAVDEYLYVMLPRGK